MNFRFKKLICIAISSLILAGALCSCADNDDESLSEQSETQSIVEESKEEIEESEESSEVIGSFIEETDVYLNTYKNPLLTPQTENAWEWYGFGDPFVMRYNGRYYLYSSTRDHESQIKVWTSDNLIDWEYAGICAESEKLTCAYAPEVTYYNGDFYMYTSPNGLGHYVLKSSSPTGPFKIVSENQGNSIDGHVFIDDNGKWYFYHAWEGSIKVKELTDPLVLHGREADAGVDVSKGWTEGPMVIKRNGVYYLTYCGNHVWSKGYRIEGATSLLNPMEFTKIPENVLMVNTDDSVYGIGHSSTVLGPDMDTYYIVYHSFTQVPQRNMHIAPICLNGNDFSVSGITTTPQQAPILPEIYTDSKSECDSFEYVNCTFENGVLTFSEGGKSITKEKIDSKTYTAEVNFLSIEDEAGVVFAYKDEKNYCSAIIDTKAQKLIIETYENGIETSKKTFSLPKSFSKNFKFNVLQNLSVKKDGKTYSFYFNGLYLGNVTATSNATKFGIVSKSGKATTGYIAISHKANGNGLKEYYKPIEGNLAAISCVENGETTKKDGTEYVVMKENYIRNYYVNVSVFGTHDIRTTYFSNENCEIEIYSGGKMIGTINLPSTDGKVSSVVTRNVPLTTGFGVISFKVKSGNTNVLMYKFVKSTVLEADTAIDLSNPYYRDGSWEMTDGKLILTPTELWPKVHGKRFYGDETWGDYAVEADFTFTSFSREVGIVIHATDPAIGGAGNDSLLGRYFYKGYYLCFDRTKGIILYKVDYEKEKALCAFSVDVVEKENIRIRVEATDTTIKVYADGNFIGEYTDTEYPFTNGSIGFTGFGSNAIIENVRGEKPTLD